MVGHPGNDTKKKRPAEPTGELFYLDTDGKRQDAALHAELLGDDECDWDVDLDEIASMSEEELARYLESKYAPASLEK